MHNFRKIMAAALAATMIVGSGITTFAAEVAVSGGTTGEGTSEGHVDKHVVSVTLPTIAEGSTPFAYTMDLERLIQETNNTKYSGATFPSKDTDTGVYFLSAADTYTNTSQELTVTSESSADVKLKVDVEVESKDTDIALVEAAPADSVTDPQLYLALKVGDTTKAVKKGEKVSAEVTIAGIPDNFETTVKEGKYVYAAKADAAGWKTSTISMSGAASKASAEGLTAPKLKVTWSWTDPEAGPSLSNATASSDAGVDFDVTFTKGTALACAFSGLGDGVTLKSVTWGASATEMTSTTTNIPLDGTSFTINSNMWGSANAGDVKYIKLTTSDSKVIVVKVTVA